MNVLHAEAKQARPVVVTLLPGDVIEFREAGRRSRWLLRVDKAFHYAVALAARPAAAEKRARRKSA